LRPEVLRNLRKQILEVYMTNVTFMKLRYLN
jgi:hypothetical protein